MEYDFSFHFKHSFSMIIARPSSSGKSVFAKQDLDMYKGPKCMIFDDLKSECVDNKMISEAFTKKRHHRNVSVIVILQNLFLSGEGNENNSTKHGAFCALCQRPR